MSPRTSRTATFCFADVTDPIEAIAFYAVLRANAVVVPVIRFLAEEIAHQANLGHALAAVS